MLKLRLYNLYERFSQQIIGPSYRIFGKNLYRIGAALEGRMLNDDRVVPSLRCVTFGQTLPEIQQASFVAPNSVIVGSVNLSSSASIWYSSTLRGDVQPIKVGQNSLLQDLVTVLPKKNAVHIGSNVVVAPNSFLEGCQIEDGAFIGMGSTVREGAKIEKWGVVAAGAVVGEKQVVPSNQVWAGNPARYLRDILPEEREALNEYHQELTELAKIHAEECEKSFRQVVDDMDKNEEEALYEPEEIALKEMVKLGFPIEPEDDDLIEQRVFNEPNRKGEYNEYPDKNNNDPYEQDLFNFPEQFKIYGENYEKYEKAKKYFEENPNVEVNLEDKMQESKDRTPSSDSRPWKDKF